MDRYVELIYKTLDDKIISNKTILHPEEYGNDKINIVTKESMEDIKKIDSNLKILGKKVSDVMNRTVKRLDIVKEIITSEKERLQDITMLCNNKTDYDNAIPLTDYHFKGDYTFKDGVFSSKETQSIINKAQVIEITGNGYEGNKYVLNINNGYLENTLDTSVKKNIVDNNISTYWEYSRVTASNTEPYLISDFNTDSAEATCTLTIQFNEKTNQLAIKSSLKDIKILSVRYSSDNLLYNDLPMMPFKINSKEDSYKEQDYIYGSNIIAFPDSYYLKITLESSGYLDETLAFERIIPNTDKNEVITTIVPTAKRHVIRINDISASSRKYIQDSIMKTEELINSNKDIYAISVFANIYLPNDIPSDYVKFVLTVNGKDYKVKPVNSYENGIKIIRFSQGKMPARYTKYIGEKITSAKLTIYIKSKNKLTPYINNLKILLGGEV